MFLLGENNLAYFDQKHIAMLTTPELFANETICFLKE